MPNSRANKPLGWFIADDIVEKMGATLKVDETKSPEDQKKRRARRGSKKNSESMTNPTPSEGSVASDDLFEDKQRADMPRDDYWYYDVASDGYYYEQNGAKGWRRRMPNSALHKIKEQEAAQVANTGKSTTLSPAQAQAAHAALLQSFYPPAMNSRYYDPSSDGYFYEMASVDGWKRRQPNSNSTSSSSSSTKESILPAPASPGSSYGAALARGQMPRTRIIDDSSASSSISEDTISTDPFGADCGFSYPEPIQRPEHLNMAEAAMLSGFNAQNFINDLSFSGLDATKIMGFKATTPADTWATRCHNWNMSRDMATSPEDDAMGQLLKGLENIWQTPTPVKNP